jgi:hypothetical protein
MGLDPGVGSSLLRGATTEVRRGNVNLCRHIAVRSFYTRLSQFQ